MHYSTNKHTNTGADRRGLYLNVNIMHLHKHISEVIPFLFSGLDDQLDWLPQCQIQFSSGWKCLITVQSMMSKQKQVSV